MTGQGIHGGEVARVAAELGCRADEVVDFSANINPRGLPERAQLALLRAVQDATSLRRYPDVGRHPLRKALAARMRVPVESVVLGAGASALITDAVRALRPKRCVVFAPAFAEYRRACEAADVDCVSIALPRDDFRLSVELVEWSLREYAPDLLVVNNPHNPSGVLMSLGELRRILDEAEEAGARVLLDEAFVDYVPGCSLVAEAARRPGVICIRSLTKFYGCPGLRVGFAVAHPETAAQIERQIPAWPICSFALDALLEAVSDQEYAEATLRDVECARQFLMDGLTKLGLVVYPAAANFVLVRLPSAWPDSSTLRDRLLHGHRVLIRDCRTFEGLEEGRFVRLAVLGRGENEKLLTGFRVIYS